MRPLPIVALALASCLSSVPIDPIGFKCATDADCAGAGFCVAALWRAPCASGCLDARGECAAGTARDACGTSAVCTSCAQGKLCSVGECIDCNGSSCAGCCAASGDCLPGAAA